jgi:hypothetical protein
MSNRRDLGTFEMKQMRNCLTALLVSCALLVPAQGLAQYHEDRDHRDREGRYYDREHRDYHEWNDRESRAWHRYWEERRRREIAWERANERQRRAYWRWRHEHPN